MEGGVIMAKELDDDFIEELGEEFLWNVVSDYVCKDIDNLKDALIKNVGRIDVSDINKITSMEIQESDEFIINEYSIDEGILNCKYEMPAIIMAKDDSEDVYLRVTTSCEGELEIPDVEKYDLGSIDFENMLLPQIREYSYIVKNISVSYEYIEADDLNA